MGVDLGVDLLTCPNCYNKSAALIAPLKIIDVYMCSLCWGSSINGNLSRREVVYKGENSTAIQDYVKNQMRKGEIHILPDRRTDEENRST